MTLMRRLPPQSLSTKPVAALLRRSFPRQEQGDSFLGVLKARRVERVDSPTEPHWYFWTLSDHDAIMKLVTGLRPRPRPDEFHVVERI